MSDSNFGAKMAAGSDSNFGAEMVAGSGREETKKRVRSVTEVEKVDDVNTYLEFFTIPDGVGSNMNDFKAMWNTRPPEREIVNCFGKHYVPRHTVIFGEFYKYNGGPKTSLPLTEIPKAFDCFKLPELMTWVSKRYGCEYNQALINYYTTHEDYIAHHSDDEKKIAQQCPIAGVHWGQSVRTFQLRKNGMRAVNHELPVGRSAYAMVGEKFQLLYTHSLPKRPATGGDERRISVTFRRLNE